MSFAVYRSSAGSGKTFTLVKDYLKILINNPYDFRHILAATFTNKAADEMKQRILSNLSTLSDPEQEEGMYAALVHDGLDAERIRRNSAIALTLILHEYHDFAVRTIDSFMHRVLKTFARDIHLPSGFEVGKEMSETTKLVAELILDQVGFEPDLTKVMKTFMRNKVRDEESSDVVKELGNYVKIILHEDSRAYLDRIQGWPIKKFFALVDHLRDRIEKRDEQLHRLGKKAVELISKAGLSDDDFQRKSTGPGPWFRKISTETLTESTPNSYVRTCGESGEWAHKKIGPGQAVALDAITPELNRIWSEVEEIYTSSLQAQRDDILVSGRLYLVALAAGIRNALKDLRDEKNYLPISDFSALVANITLNEAVPFIYERLGEKYKHFLLDEFQDTSVLQWHNLIPLLENALSTGGLSLIVGDAKQSIYRWRAGDAEQFLRLPEIGGKIDYPLLKEREQAFKQHYQSYELGKNYRSAAQIVDFNNTFFRFAAGFLPEDTGKAYDGLEQEVVKTTKAGIVRMAEVQVEDQDKDEAFAELISEELKEIASRRSLQDIAILCRGNKEASVIAQHLLSKGYPVVSAESVLLSASPVVRVLITTMGLLLEPENRLARLELMNDLVITKRIPPTSLNEIMDSAGLGKGDDIVQLWEWLSKHNILLDAKHLLTLPLYELLEHLVRDFGFSGLPDVYLQFLLESVQDLARGRDANLQAFIQWWEEQGSKTSVSVPPGLDAIRIMTIHKAKGLEFPVVIYPVVRETTKLTQAEQWAELDSKDYEGLEAAYLPMSLNSLEGSSWEERALEEQAKSALDILNVHYVAMTRPTEELIILLNEEPGRETSSPTAAMALNRLLPSFLKVHHNWSLKEGEFIFGVKPERASTGFEKSERNSDFSMVSWPWEERLEIRLRAPDYWDNSGDMDPRSRGILAHHVMSMIKTADDVDNALDAERKQGNLREDQLPELRAQIERILGHEKMKPYFNGDWEVRNEAEIILAGKDQIVRPDRVLVQGENAVVIDYKTGEPNDRNLEQIRYYAELLRDMGYTNVNAFLAYLPSGLIVEA